jgi:hypothetical protein
MKADKQKLATQIGHWPGQDTPVCDEHKAKLQAIGRAIGITVTFTPCDPTICKNCENEEIKKLEKMLE